MNNMFAEISDRYAISQAAIPTDPGVASTPSRSGGDGEDSRARGARRAVSGPAHAAKVSATGGIG